MKIQIGCNRQESVRKYILKSVFVLHFLMLFNFLATAQKRKIETGNFFTTNYSRSFLNSISGNWSILQDPEGVIYIGNTYDGVLVYDGQKIRRVFIEV